MGLPAKLLRANVVYEFVLHVALQESRAEGSDMRYGPPSAIYIGEGCTTYPKLDDCNPEDKPFLFLNHHTFMGFSGN